MKKGCATGRGFWFAAVVAAVLFLNTTAVYAETLTVPGTGACEPIVSELAEAFNRATPGDRVTVPPSTGSGGGISAVLKGEAPLARVARPLKDSEEKEGLVQVVFARDAVAFVVGRQVKIANLSARQLAAIFSGKIADWKEVGGPAGPIRVIAREPGDSSLIVIQKQLDVFHNLAFSPRAKVLLYDRATVETLDKYKNSIGFVTLSSMRWSNGGITPISLDGVAPTRQSIFRAGIVSRSTTLLSSGEIRHPPPAGSSPSFSHRRAGGSSRSGERSPSTGDDMQCGERAFMYLS